MGVGGDTESRPLPSTVTSIYFAIHVPQVTSVRVTAGTPAALELEGPAVALPSIVEDVYNDMLLIQTGNITEGTVALRITLPGAWPPFPQSMHLGRADE